MVSGQEEEEVKENKKKEMEVEKEDFVLIMPLFQ